MQIANELSRFGVSVMRAYQDTLEVGHASYKWGLEKIEVLEVRVEESQQGRGVGRQLIQRLKGMLTHRRKTLVIDCDEYNLDGQCFLRACGLTCVTPRAVGGFYTFVYKSRKRLG